MLTGALSSAMQGGTILSNEGGEMLAYERPLNERLLRACGIYFISMSSGAFLNTFIIMTPMFAKARASYNRDATYLLSPYLVIVAVFGLCACVGGFVAESTGARLIVLLAAAMVGLGGFLTASGVVLGNIFMMIVGYSVLGGCGCAFAYIGPSSTLYSLFPELKRSTISALYYSGFALGPIVLIPIVKVIDQKEVFSQSPDLLYAIITAVLSTIIVIGTFACTPQGECEEKHTKDRLFCIELDEIGLTKGIPLFYIDMKNVILSVDFIASATALCCAIVPGILNVPSILHGLALGLETTSAEATELIRWGFIILECFFSGAFLGYISSAGIARFLDMKLTIIVVLTLHVCIYSTTSIVRRINGEIPLILTEVALEGISYGVIMGSMITFLGSQFGLYIARVLKGCVLAGLVFFMLGIAPAWITMEFVPSTFVRTIRNCYITVSCIGYFALLFVNTDPYRKMLRYLGDNTFCFPLVLGCDIEISSSYIRFETRNSKRQRVLSILKLREENPFREIPHSRRSLQWRLWSIRSALAGIFSSLLIIYIAMFYMPLVAMTYQVSLNTTEDANINDICSIVIQPGISRNEIVRFVAYSAIGILLTVVVSVILGFTSLYALLTPFQAAIERLSDPETLVFDNTPHYQKYISILELNVLNNQTELLRKSLHLFSLFVPETIVRRALQDETYRKPYGVRRTVTILFMDMKSISESLETLKDQELLECFSLIFSQLSNIVDKHQGVIAELLEDGLLVFWNSPDDVPDHVSLALACAIDLSRKAHELGDFFKETKGFPDLAIHIGIHAGVVTTGVVGVVNKMKFGCVGDAMNVASRTKGLCKHFHVQIIFTDACINLDDSIRGQFVFRPLGIVRVVGKTTPTEIFDLIGKTYEVDDSIFATLNVYADALNAFQHGQFTLCMELLDDCRSLDVASQMLFQRASDAKEKFGDDSSAWDGGILDATSK